MKQQNFKVVVRPAKSHSARSFFKLLPKDRHSPLRFKTLHTEPLQPPSTFKLNNQKFDNKSYRHTARVKELSSFHPPEELQEQNMRLKGKVNRLTEELVRQKVKRTQDTRHYLKMQRQVELQFDDDKYLDLSRNQNKMIEGVKHQYQKMKIKYEQKCQEYNALLKRYEISGGEQQRFEIEALRTQNIKLRQKLKLLLQTQERIVGEYNKIKQRQSKNHGGGGLSSSRSKQKKQEITLDLIGYASKMVEMEKNIEDLKQKNAILSARIQNLKATISERKHKINFLDKLIIEKSNQNHHLIMQDRKIQKENKYLASTLEEIKYRLEKQNQVHREEMVLLKEKERIKFQTERCIFVTTLKEKDQQIQKISSELKYVTTLISYIKTGDEPFPEKFNPLSKKLSQKERSQEMLMNLEKSLISFQGNDVRERVKSFIQSGRKQLHNHRVQSNSETLKKVPLLSEGDDVGVSQSELDIQADEQVMLESRMVKKSYLKHSKDCIRMKHVKIEQLQGFRLDLVYRLIYYRISSTAVKDYLSYKPTPTEESSLPKRELRWRSRYLSMNQARSKLLLYPFELLPEQATLLARYMIEDATKEDLFYHEENEIQRNIAKSILKAFVGEYLIPDENRVREEIKEVLSKSGKNLRSALTSLAPTGTISHFKFLEISIGINVDFSEEAQNYIIGQLASQSPGGISALLYDKLFDSL